jgi:hypothetical protein
MDKNQVIELGPLRIEGHGWGGDKVTYYNLRASVITKQIAFSASFSTAPSGLFLSTSLSGSKILKYLNKW